MIVVSKIRVIMLENLHELHAYVVVELSKKENWRSAPMQM